MFFIQLYPIFTVLRLNSLCRGLFMGKCLSMSFKNSFPRCVFSDILYGGVYQITSLVLFLLLDLLGSVVLSYFSLVAYPLVVSAFSYSTLFSLNIFSDEERSLSLLFTALGKFSFTWRGWFEYIFIYIGSSFGFLNGMYVSLLRSNVTSKKLTFMVFISVVIFSPISLKRFTIFVFMPFS